MAIINYKAEADKLIAAITKNVKNVKGCYVQDILSGPTKEKNTYWFQVSSCSPSYICDVIGDTINKSKCGIVIQTEAHEGSFDWQSDTYIKDCSIVTFTLR